MLPLKNQVCRRELAERLKELKVPQDGYFRWLRTEHTWFVENALSTPDEMINHGEWYSAFLASELGEMIKRGAKTWYQSDPDGWNCMWGSNIVKQEATEADARAALLIHLLEQKVIMV